MIDIDKNMTSKEMAYEAIITLRAIQDRIDRHSVEWHEGLKTINQKLDVMKDEQASDKVELLKKIQEVEVSSLRDHSASKIKIATLSGAVSVIVSMGLWLLGLIKKP